MEKNPVSLLDVSLGKALDGMLSSSCARQVAGPSSLPIMVAQSDEKRMQTEHELIRINRKKCLYHQYHAVISFISSTATFTPVPAIAKMVERSNRASGYKTFLLTDPFCFLKVMMDPIERKMKQSLLNSKCSFIKYFY